MRYFLEEACRSLHFEGHVRTLACVYIGVWLSSWQIISMSTGFECIVAGDGEFGLAELASLSTEEQLA